MPKRVVPLTDPKIKHAKTSTKDYILTDGHGLYLLIKKTWAKIWRFTYYRPITNKRSLISFGAYPAISLQNARKQRDDARELIVNNIDPLEYRKKVIWHQNIKKKILF